ncbi:hypothetical protein [Pseudofrankia sp. DC12]|uniref:hypothetical protein n=1 Tax=Pseudofrankia sp. DC12 TaxID=683315 RepID=UPI000AF41C01|nr:hypothetical protein [Pseudofrankia sp. DC12]
MGQLTSDGRYVIDTEDRRRFTEDGYVHLPGILTAAEVDELEIVYDRFLRREIDVPGRDYCDMAGDYGRDPSDFSIVNVMLPRRCFPAWRDIVQNSHSARFRSKRTWRAPVRATSTVTGQVRHVPA